MFASFSCFHHRVPFTSRLRVWGMCQDTYLDCTYKTETTNRHLPNTHFAGKWHFKILCVCVAFSFELDSHGVKRIIASILVWNMCTHMQCAPINTSSYAIYWNANTLYALRNGTRGMCIVCVCVCQCYELLLPDNDNNRRKTWKWLGKKKQRATWNVLSLLDKAHTGKIIKQNDDLKCQEFEYWIILSSIQIDIVCRCNFSFLFVYFFFFHSFFSRKNSL